MDFFAKKPMAKKLVILGGMMLCAIAVFALRAADKDLLILQCGSDWCESGEDVRRVFESPEFRRALGNRFDFAVYDDMDEPTPEVKAANEKLAKLRVELKRYPGIICLTPEPRRFFAQIENIPFDITAKKLAADILAAAKAKDEAVSLFRKSAQGTDGRVSMRGRVRESSSARFSRTGNGWRI